MEQITIGILVNTHGLRGEVKIKTMTDFPEIRFKKGAVIHLQTSEGIIPLKIKNVREQKGLLLVKFDGYDDINQVEKWKGSVLSIDQKDVHELEEDEAYFFELKNCEVFDEQGSKLGVVSEVLDTNANAILRVKGENGDILIPYVKAFIQSFSREEKRIVVHLVEGML